MTYKTLKVGDRIKCFNKDEADHLVYILHYLSGVLLMDISFIMI